MIISVPITYYVDYVKPRCTNSSKTTCGEFVDIEVREVSDLEAPVATRWAARWETEGLDGIHETRWFEGRHYKPVIYSASREKGVHVTLDGVIDDCRNGSYYANPLVGGNDHYLREVVNGKIKPQSDIAMRRLDASERDDEIAKAHSRAESLLVVDGMMWRVCPEPVYKVTRSSSFRDSYVFIDVSDVDLVKSGREDAVYRADRFDDAIDHARHMGLQPDEDRENARRIDLFIPESITYDDETPALIDLMDRVLEWDRSGLAGHSTDRIVAWANMRDAIRQVHETNLEIDIATAVAALSAYADALPETDYFQGVIRDGLQRWNNRPLSIDLASAGY